jgi:DNA adenine methylase
MQYLGGKSKIAKWLAAAIRPVRAGRPFWDAFCGGLSCAVALSEDGPGLATDANLALVSLYRAVAAGWDPPATVSEDEYRAARDLPDTHPLKAFAGFGCSFGGKWFAGYARSKDPTDKRSVLGYAKQARDVVTEDVAMLRERGVELAHCDFLAVEPRPIGAVLYLDPPYDGTTKYSATGAFDRARFLARVAAWSRLTDVFVSEYEMPGRPVLEFAHELQVRGRGRENAQRRERLYHYHPGAPL